ncbi:hypothetical protein [Archaeoglobus sp.]
MRVATTVPDEWKPLLQKAAKSEGFTQVGRWVFDLIRKELLRKGYLSNGGDSNE